MTDDDLKEIKKTIIKSIFSDDEFYDKFILKGGNALDIIYNITHRPSKDIDISIEDDIAENEIEKYENKFNRVLKESFQRTNYHVFDIELVKRPKTKKENNFWGGYRVTFKLTTKERFEKYHKNIQSLRTSALNLGKGQKTEFIIDISKYEVRGYKIRKEIDNLYIHVYPVKLIFVEKLRAICQQIPEYYKINDLSDIRRPRARDFYDIYMIDVKMKISKNKENISEIKSMISDVFDIKRVPINYLWEIEKYREYHSSDYSSLRDTLPNKENLKEFDFYFDYVVDICNKLKGIWDV